MRPRLAWSGVALLRVVCVRNVSLCLAYSQVALVARVVSGRVLVRVRVRVNLEVPAASVVP